MRSPSARHQADATALAADHGEQALLGLVDVRQMVRRHRHAAEPALFDGDIGQRRIEPHAAPARDAPSRRRSSAAPCGRARPAPAGRRRSCGSRRGCAWSPTPPALPAGSWPPGWRQRCRRDLEGMQRHDRLGEAGEQTVRYRRWSPARPPWPAILCRFRSKCARDRPSLASRTTFWRSAILTPAAAATRASSDV